MASSNQLLDDFKPVVPEPDKTPKIRKFYFWIFELLIGGCIILTPILLFVLCKDTFLSNLLIVIFCFVPIYFYLTFSHALLLYKWLQASLYYDQSFDKTIIKEFKEMSTGDIDKESGSLLSLAMGSHFLILLIAIGSLLSGHLPSFIHYLCIVGVLYTTTSSIYFFLVYHTINKLLK